MCVALVFYMMGESSVAGCSFKVSMPASFYVVVCVLLPLQTRVSIDGSSKGQFFLRHGTCFIEQPTRNQGLHHRRQLCDGHNERDCHVVTTDDSGSSRRRLYIWEGGLDRARRDGEVQLHGTQGVTHEA